MILILLSNKSILYSVVCKWSCRGQATLTCKEFEERYELKMRMKSCDDVTLSTEFLPINSLARNKLSLTISSRTHGYVSRCHVEMFSLLRLP